MGVDLQNPSGPAQDVSQHRRTLMRVLNPPAIRSPFAAYAHGVEVPAALRWVCTSGQLGVLSDDTVPDTPYAQAVQCLANCAAILAEAGMGPADVVRINAFVTDREHMAGYMQARDEWLAGLTRLPASTLVIVSGFTRPEFLVEIEVTAAAP
jgi:enamine deaminase RidA (YjgF/YER057c/UK114 family)